MKIYMPLKDGQVISQEVMKGIIVNNLEVAPITTKGEAVYRESNRNGNVLRAIEQVKELDEKYLMIMDSDIILTWGIINEVLDEKRNFNKNIRTLSTNKGTHGLIYIKRESLDHFENYLRNLDYTGIDDHEHCTICSYLDNNLNIILANDIENFDNNEVKECERSK